MSAGRGGTLIALAAVAGAGLALVLQKPSARSHAAPEPPAPTQTTSPDLPASPGLAATTAAGGSATAAVGTATAEATSSADPTVAQPPIASAAPGVPRVPPPPEVADLAELQTAEIRCYQRDADACFRAAAAYAAGKLVPTDEKRAQNYRKVELTQLFRQCEKAAVRPCLVLAERYAHGDGLPLDAKKSQKLVQHVAEVCQRRPVAECELLSAGVK